MKQNWEKEIRIILEEQVVNYTGLFDEATCCSEIQELIHQSKQEEKERILKWAKDYIERDMKLFGTDKHGIALEDIEFFLNN